mmetsp:Transcript_59378/g.145265  ORF Transcript_59378/g.145265 Transcript_59378/m.145265 type:complete len:2104 (+) Transcript_59378:138-6449(+)
MFQNILGAAFDGNVITSGGGNGGPVGGGTAAAAATTSTSALDNYQNGLRNINNATASAVTASSSPNNPNVFPTTNSSKKSNDRISTPSNDAEEGKDSNNNKNEDEDGVADQLFTAFPPYGTRSQAHQTHGQLADWMLGGTSGIPTTKQQQMQNEYKQLQMQILAEELAAGSGSGPRGGGGACVGGGIMDNKRSGDRGGVGGRLSSGNNNVKFCGEWDDDQVHLWKKQNDDSSGAPATSSRSILTPGTNRRPSTIDEDQARHQRYLYGTPYQRPKLEDPSKQMMAAYYYHVGIIPPVSDDIIDDDDNNYKNNHGNNERNTTMEERGRDYPYRHHHTYLASSQDERGLGLPRTYDHMDKKSQSKPNFLPRFSEIDEIAAAAEEKNESESFSQSLAMIKSEGNIKTMVTTATNNRAIGPTILGGSSNNDDDRTHWMPDRLCKTCYACEKEFTVFRRRHHCRICGQIFCNACSAHFVPAANISALGDQKSTASLLLRSTGTSSSSLSVSSSQNTSQTKSSPLSTATTAVVSSGLGGVIPPTLQSAGGSNSTVLRACKMCYDQYTAKREQMEQLKADNEQLGIDASARKRRHNKSNPNVAAVLQSPTSNSQSSPNSKFGVTSPTTTSPSKSNSLNEQLDDSSSLLHELSRKSNENADNAQTAQRLLSQQQEIEQDEKEQASILLPYLKDKRSGEGGDFEKKSTVIPLNRLTSHSSVESGPNNSTAVDNQSDNVRDGNRHLGLTAASHLERMVEALLQSDAPRLWQQISDDENLKSQWINKFMSLITRCCATVDPNIKKGDMLDIRPYVKIKVIPGGSFKDSSFVSGIVFRKTGTSKQMPREIVNPSIMLLSGGIEFTRTENRIASLDTLLEQEDKYIEILVGKILKVKPDVLIVGKAVSRSAQELLMKNNVQLLQHVKASLLSRISRQTGATIISSTDHIMNQFGAHVLGKCNRFRFIVARDNSVWEKEQVDTLLSNPKLSHSKRQAALAADQLGENILDGSEAIRCGLAKRGVTTTYVMLEGCPKDLGCTVVLRGADRAALKQTKNVFRFLVSAAYNMKLELSYLKERCARLDRDYKVEKKHLFSSSLSVDYGTAPSNRKVRPWNGGANNESVQRSISGQITAFDHQSILITSVWMTDKTQCCPAEVKGISYYSMQDVSLGQFLRDSCFNLSLKCQNPNCKKSVLDHSLSFVHNDGLINITVDHMQEELPPAPESAKSGDGKGSDPDDDEDIDDAPIATWTYCKSCRKVVTPLVWISEDTWKYSFGKFLESSFYNHDTRMNSPASRCQCELQKTVLFFGCGRLAARFTHERIRPFGVFVRKHLPIDPVFHLTTTLQQLQKIAMASSSQFVKFDKHIEKVAREARALLGLSSNVQLKTVLAELSRISNEVDHAAKTLQEKIASVSDKCLKEKEESRLRSEVLDFPWLARRYLYMLTSAWNEKLSAAGQAIVAAKKLDTANTPAIVGDQNMDDLNEGIRRLRQLHEVYSRYNLSDIHTVLPTIPGSNDQKLELEFDDDFDDTDGDFASEGVDADVLASRRRLYQTNVPQTALDVSRASRRGEQDTISNSQITAKVTPGGAVKSAINRFFNRGSRDRDPYIVDLGMFREGRPRLEPGVNGIVVPVFDEQLSTVIAYSLSSKEYESQFQNYSSMEAANPETPTSSLPTDNGTGTATLHQQLPPRGSQSSNAQSFAAAGSSSKQGIERRMLLRNKSHIKHTFRDFDEKNQSSCKFVITHYWATQFSAVREAFLSSSNSGQTKDGGIGTDNSNPSGLDVEQAYVLSLSSAYSWAASGGKSGASFARTTDDRFVIKHISRTELQMFLDCAPAYFEYLSKAFFHGLPTVLCKIVGVYQIGYHNRETGKRSMEQIAVMQNIFYNKKITKIFDLKGSLRGRFAAHMKGSSSSIDDQQGQYYEGSSSVGGGAGAGMDSSTGSARQQQLYGQQQKQLDVSSDKNTSSGIDADVSVEDETTAGGNSVNKTSSNNKNGSGTLLDGDFLEYMSGRPMPMLDRAKAVFHMSILNDTLFLSIINVLDYSILVGIDEEKNELVVGIIDFMRQYDILKQMERVGKSLPMVVGAESPTIIQPPLYKARFTNAMERYFMTVPSKWTSI